MLHFDFLVFFFVPHNDNLIKQIVHLSLGTGLGELRSRGEKKPFSAPADGRSFRRDGGGQTWDYPLQTFTITEGQANAIRKLSVVCNRQGGGGLTFSPQTSLGEWPWMERKHASKV